MSESHIINQANIKELNQTLEPGQRFVIIGDILLPVGIDRGAEYPIDLVGVTVTADDILSGVVAIGPTGEKVVGKIGTVTPTLDANVFSVDRGYVAQPVTISVNVSSDPVVADNVVIIPAGYSEEDRSVEIPLSVVTETETDVTITPGYVGEELSYQLSSGDSVDLSFITAGAGDIRSGKVGADVDGNPVYGTLVPGSSGGGDVSSDEVKKFAIIF